MSNSTRQMIIFALFFCLWTKQRLFNGPSLNNALYIYIYIQLYIYYYLDWELCWNKSCNVKQNYNKQYNKTWKISLINSSSYLPTKLKMSNWVGDHLSRFFFRIVCSLLKLVFHCSFVCSLIEQCAVPDVERHRSLNIQVSCWNRILNQMILNNGVFNRKWFWI